MALTDYEKKVLEQMEAQLREGDPELAAQMAADPSTPDEAAPARPRAPRRIALGGVGAIVGMVVLVAAVSLGYSLWSILLGVVGFALTVSGILYAVSRPGSSRRASRGAGATRPQSSQKNDKQGGWDSFIADQEKRWDERRDDD